MLQTGEYTTYKEFGNDLIQKIRRRGIYKGHSNAWTTKIKDFGDTQGIILKYYGFKAKASDTIRHLDRNSYDCLIQYENEDVTFETICNEIIRKYSETENEISLVKNILYIFWKL